MVKKMRKSGIPGASEGPRRPTFEGGKLSRTVPGTTRLEERK